MNPTTITRVRVGDWLPDAWVDGDDIELAVTEPVAANQVIIVIPAASARAWAAATDRAIHAAHDRAVPAREATP